MVKVERLIRQWAPVVWLAPEEKFMPLGVEEFLAHVHPESKDNSFTPGMSFVDNSEKSYLVTNAEIGMNKRIKLCLKHCVLLTYFSHLHVHRSTIRK